MLLSLWGKRWKEVNLVMSNLFTAFVDDSGTDPCQKVAIATGLIIPARKIVALEKEWNTLKKKWGFSCFHMSEFAARNGKYESQFAQWSDDEHDKVFARVRAISKKYGVMVVSFAVNKKDYDEVVPPEVRSYAGKFHYSWAVRQFISYMGGWREHVGTGPLEYVFDHMKKNDPRRVEIEEIMEQAEVLTGSAGDYVNYGFRNRCDLPGLQCVDMLAWISYQSALMVYTKKSFSRDALVGWQDLDKVGEDWRLTLAVNRDRLAEWAHDEATHGTARARYKLWENYKMLKGITDAKS